MGPFVAERGRANPSEYEWSKVGFPIRKSSDQSSFAAPQGLSQRTTSFIASQRQGIHRTPLRHLITLMIDVRRSEDGNHRQKDHCSWTAFRQSRTYACQPGPRSTRRLRAMAGQRGMWIPASRTWFLFTISNIRAPARRRSARISMTPDRCAKLWWSQTGSNRRPHACKARALPTELWPLSEDSSREAGAGSHGGPGTTRTSDLTLIRGAL